MAARRGIAASAVLAAVLALAACMPASPPADDVPHDAPSGGQTLQQMEDSLAAVPGLTFEISGGGPPNIKRNTGYQVAVTVQPGHHIVDGPALVTFLVESVWSVRQGYMPNAQISVSVAAGEGSDFDVAAAAAKAGWTDPLPAGRGNSGFTSASIVVYDGSPARTRLGDWPGAVPAVPRGVTAQD